jgi:hypothetical protein
MKAKAFKLPAGGWEVQAGAVVNGLVADLKLKDFQAAGSSGALATRVASSRNSMRRVSLRTRAAMVGRSGQLLGGLISSTGAMPMA